MQIPKIFSSEYLSLEHGLYMDAYIDLQIECEYTF